MVGLAFFSAAVEWFTGAWPDILVSLIILAAAFVITHFLPKIIAPLYHRLTDDDAALHHLTTVAQIVIWVLAILLVLERVGFPMASLLTVIAAIGAAVALAVRDNLANFASGLVLLFTKPFKSGDFITVDDVSGYIDHIQLTYTFIDTLEKVRIAIPNSQMTSAKISNISTNGTRRMDVHTSVSYETELDEVRRVLLEVAAEDSRVLTFPEPVMVVKGHGDNGVTVALRVWAQWKDSIALEFYLSEKIKNAFDKNGIVIPFPQVDVHMK